MNTFYRTLSIAFTLGGVLASLGCGDDEPCFSPKANLDQAYDDGAQGCKCTPGADADQCLPDSTGRQVALICREDGHWNAVEDGPCEPVGH